MSRIKQALFLVFAYLIFAVLVNVLSPKKKIVPLTPEGEDKMMDLYKYGEFPPEQEDKRSYAWE